MGVLGWWHNVDTLIKEFEEKRGERAKERELLCNGERLRLEAWWNGRVIYGKRTRDMCDRCQSV